jgi:tRNA pseudouridine38-40 synthase
VRHVRLVVEYDGTDLHGWQRQANAPTVQQHLEEALAQLLVHDVTVVGASRTDAGVHARGQVASFRTERAIPLHGIRRGLNTLLPGSIAVRDVAEVSDDFHPRFSATSKHYRYTILARSDRAPRWRSRAWHHAEPLAIGPMRMASSLLIGEHDFSAFRAAGCTANTPTRRIDSIAITRSDPDGSGELLEIDIRGNAFLRQMVRIIVGTLADVGTLRRPPAQVAEILASLDRTQAGPTAPPHGLELIEVRYDGRRAEHV